MESLIGKGQQNSLVGRYSFEQDVHALKATMTGDEYYFSDHCIKGKAVLPASAYLEMACTGGFLIAGKQEWQPCLTGLMWMRQLEARDAHLIKSIFRCGIGNTYRIEVITEDDIPDTKPKVYMMGKCLPEPPKLEINTFLDTVSPEKGRRTSCTRNEIYTSLKASGFDYGAGFQTIESFEYTGNTAVSQVMYPLHLDDYKSFILHPTLLDGGIQTAIFLLKSKLKNNQLYLPFSLARLDVLVSPLPREVFVYTRLFENSLGSGIPKFNLIFKNKEGRNLLCLSGFALKEFNSVLIGGRVHTDENR